jgi:DNA polymerase-3 subunit gamma/tau
VQLYYQLALMGQRDLNLAPSPKAGMEMVLLRMIAFRPAGMESSVTKSAAPTHSAPAKPIIQQPDQHIKQTKPTQTSDASNVAPAIQSSATTSLVNIQPVHADDIPPATSQQTNVSNDWETVLNKLKLRGLTKEFASHCTLQSINDKQCILLLDPAHSQLQNNTVHKGLQQAIHNQLNPALKLVIKLESQQQESPAGKRTRISDERQQAAQVAIEQDDNVKALQQQFDATIIPGSVEPLDDTGEH